MSQLLLYCLAGVGTGFLVRSVVIPITKGLMFALGYTIFEAWKWNLKKITKHPRLACKTIIKNFGEGFVMFCDYGTVTCITSGNKQWTPYFNYSKESKGGK